jgi:myosin heavy subunit
MADETIILSVEAEGYESIARTTGELKKLRQTVSELDKGLKDGTLTLDDYAKKMAENMKAQADLTTAKKASIENLKKEQSAVKDAAGSINEMRKTLSGLTKEYNALSKAERESETGTALQTKINSLSGELKTLEGGVGNFTRNVGDYTNKVYDALQKFFPEIEAVNNVLKDLGISQEQVTNTIKSFTQAEQIQIVATETNTVATETQTAANEGLAGSTVIAAKGFDILKASLLSNPITLIIVAVASLITYLTQFDGAMDKIEQAWEGLKAAAKPLIGVLGQLGSIIYDVVELYLTPMITAFKVAGRIMEGDFKGAVETVKNEFNGAVDKATGLIDKTTDLGKSMNNLGSDMSNAASAAMELTKATQDLEDAQGQLALKTVLVSKQIEQAERIADDKTQGRKARIESLNKAQELAIDLGKEQADLDSKLAQQQVRDVLKISGLKAEYWSQEKKYTADQIVETGKLLKQLSDQGKLQGNLQEAQKSLEEATKKQLDSEQKVRDITLDYAAKSGKLRVGLQEEEAQAAKASADARAKAIADKLKMETEYRAQLKKIAELEAASAEDGPEKLRARQKLLAMALEDDLKAAGKNNELKLALTNKYNADVAALQTEFMQQQTSEFEQERADATAKAKQDQQDELADLDEQYKRRQLVIQQGLELGLVTDSEAKQQEIDASLEHLTALADLQKSFGESTVDTELQISKQRLAIKQQTADKEAKIQQAQIETAKNAVNAIASLGSILMGNSAAGAEFQKGIALLQIGIDTASAIAGIVRIASTTSPDPITFAVQLSAGIAAVLTNIAKATQLLDASNAPSAPKLQKAQKGGYVTGNLHSNGGIPMELEGGEYIVGRGGTGLFQNHLAMMNAAGGGQGYGATIDATRLQEQIALNQEYAMTKAAKSLPAPIVSTRDIARTNQDAVRVINKATI